MTSKLLVRPGAPDTKGRVLSVTPESAGWRYVGFDVHRLRAGQSVECASDARELCLVLVAGKAAVSVGAQDFGIVGRRMTPFEGMPWSAYVPPKTRALVRAETDVELAVCSAPAQGKLPPRAIPAESRSVEQRGSGTNLRRVVNILPETEPAESLLVVEVITPGGNWSSYPPHKHDSDALPAESSLEETYYHRLNPAQGFAFQRIYTDDRSIDETIAVENGDCVMVPRGYHPVGAPHGYDLYYLNVMAGPRRIWKFHNDPAHEWIVAKR